ncbi:ABC transporter ATP-binding protein [Streptomyces sp. NPDC002490]|uniref:ABC transporter ATP-binding protein n=1 Tax=Streptomyces sp. NPDC002490 TaxID=3154416 RepID=UPI0033248B46
MTATDPLVNHHHNVLLRLEGLRVHYPGGPGRDPVVAVDDLSLTVASGSTVAVVGESGSGKSTTLKALLGLVPRTARVGLRRLEFRDGHGVLRVVPDVRALRGRSVGLVPQDPGDALDPLMRIGAQFAELHRHFLAVTDREESRALTAAALDAVGVDRPLLRLRQYPHELSGGQRQRVLIALALVGTPRLLLADEPTSQLDATVQRRVLDLIDGVRARHGLAVLMVTHDIAVAAGRAEHLLVMRAGRVVESGPTARVLDAPEHPYTRQLLGARPDALPARPVFRPEAPARVVLEARGLVKSFRAGRAGAPIEAVRDVSLTVQRGQTVAVVGESGAGKSTLLRLLTGQERADAGAVLLDGEELFPTRRRHEPFARRVQLVYQNPARSLDPLLTLGRAVAEPLEAHRLGDARWRAGRARELLEQVGLPGAFAERRPPELSGGQLQRAAIARALALEPDVVVLDEPVSALDQAVQFALLELLDVLQQRHGIAYLLVSHDLSVVRAVADEVLVMRHGRIEERGPAAEVFDRPQHPFTRELLAAVPVLPRPGPPHPGDVPSDPAPRTNPHPHPADRTPSP